MPNELSYEEKLKLFKSIGDWFGSWEITDDGRYILCNNETDGENTYSTLDEALWDWIPTLLENTWCDDNWECEIETIINRVPKPQSCMYAVEHRAYNGDLINFFWFRSKEQAVKKFKAECERAMQNLMDDPEAMTFLQKSYEKLELDMCNWDSGDYTLIKVIEMKDGNSYELNI